VYGTVSAFDFVGHLTRSDALALLRERRRLLEPRGIVLLKVPNGANPAVADLFVSDLTHETLYTGSSIAQIATLAGFAHCQIREVGPMPHGVKSLVRYALWRGVRAWYRNLKTIETGALGTNVITRVMLVRLVS